jgi:hypothetical protein
LERKNTEYEWSEIKEGEVTLLVPSQAINQKEPPKFPAFFNPAAKYNRDISILIYRNSIDQSRKNISFVDSMCGLGARGVRVAKEIPQIQKVVFNDFNMLSTQTAKVNAIINNIYHKSALHRGARERMAVEVLAPQRDEQPATELGAGVRGDADDLALERPALAAGRLEQLGARESRKVRRNG